MITALPEGLRGAVDKAVEAANEDAGKFDPSYCTEEAIRAAILAFLNAALDAGVAREGGGSDAMWKQYAVAPDDRKTGEYPVIIIRTGP